jgi:exopolyphosphatase/guanosine-5'-triphosphate,3'-diphosphate pyrophosphatase
VVDIGGGSTELVTGTDAARGAVSLDVGCVRLTEMFLASDPPAPEELSNAVGYVRDLLADVDRVLPDAKLARTCIAVAGTATTVALVDQALAAYDRDAVHGYVLTRAAAEDVFRMLALDPADERALHPGLEADRVDVIVGGVIALVCIMRHYELDAVVVSETDLLDGLARAQAGISTGA